MKYSLAIVLTRCQTNTHTYILDNSIYTTYEPCFHREKGCYLGSLPSIATYMDILIK
uniref:Uncharacterized protein n=1 Tax=Anguilla anguilla TaxID=7936 RepID=A0A0E9RA39_ANGAN